MRLFKRTEPKELPSLATAIKLFSPAECDRIIEIGVRQTQYTGGLMQPAAGAPTETKRKSNVGWIHPGLESDFIFDRLERIASEVNQNTFQFSLIGFGEPLQFTTYSGGGSHYGWHQDIGGVPRAIASSQSSSSSPILPAIAVAISRSRWAASRWRPRRRAAPA